MPKWGTQSLTRCPLMDQQVHYMLLREPLSASLARCLHVLWWRPSHCHHFHMVPTQWFDLNGGMRRHAVLMLGWRWPHIVISVGICKPTHSSPVWSISASLCDFSLPSEWLSGWRDLNLSQSLKEQPFFCAVGVSAIAFLMMNFLLYEWLRRWVIIPIRKSHNVPLGGHQ